MQIVRNTTNLQADLSVATDKHGHDHCVVVAKASFIAGPGGQVRLADEQAPLVYADELTGAPERSSTAWETDFAPLKPLTDVIVNGKAVAPGRIPATEVLVRLEVNGWTKDALVIGERRWVSAAGFVTASPPVAFEEMPLTWGRAFGGPGDARNPAGVGFGEELPSIEDPTAQIRSTRDRPRPRGFSWVGRAWQPRIAFAGTYDRRWRREQCPLLPEDFDDRYFQAAPEDQQFPHFRGGERIRCTHMAEQPIVEFRVPHFTIQVHFDFGEHLRQQIAVLDTVVLEPHRHQMHLIWRASISLPKQITRLRGVYVGEPPAQDGPIGRRRGKPFFAGLGSFVRWAKRGADIGGSQ